MSGICIGHAQIFRPNLGQFFQIRKTPAIVEMKKLKQIKAVARLSHSESRTMEQVVNKKTSQGNLPFDICQQPLPSYPEGSVLEPGMVLLKDYVPLDGQVKIVRECRRLGVRKGGFYHPQPGPNLHMMCLGLHWEPATYKYVKERSFDGAKPPPIPHTFIKLTTSAIAAANHLIYGDDLCGDPSKMLPLMEPDICRVNFYEPDNFHEPDMRLGIHQDKDESRRSLDKGLPVVSISLGDSAIFVYGNTRDVSKMRKVVLKSGDVLIFGGRSRLIFHGVESIIPYSGPIELMFATNFRSGRLNLTFRKY